MSFELILNTILPFDQPSSRLFIFNLLSSALLMVGFLLWRKKDFGQMLSKTFSRRYWINRSTKKDFGLYLFNAMLKVILFVPLLDFSFAFSQWTIEGLELIGGEPTALPVTWYYLLLATIAAFAFDDFLRFAHHILAHRSNLLYYLHRVHHSARILTPITLFRAHPGEVGMAVLRNSMSWGISTGLFVHFFGGPIDLVTLLGINLFGFSFNLIGANLRHSHIPISFGSLEWVFISPRMHQLHHSRLSKVYNYGVCLSIWDQLFGTFRRPDEDYVYGKFMMPIPASQ